MKKKIFVLGMALTLATSIFAGCGNNGQSTDNVQETTESQEENTQETTNNQGKDDQETTADSEEYDNILAEMEETNQLSTIVDKHERVLVTGRDIMADGESYSYIIYRDKNKYVYENDYMTLVEEGELVYSNDKEINELTIINFIEGGYEIYEGEYVFPAVYVYDEHEYVVSSEVKDGKLYLKTEVDVETAKSFGVDYGYAEEDVDGEFLEYVINCETKEMLELKVYLVIDEQDVLVSEMSIDVAGEEYIPDESIRKTIEESEQRTVTIITDAGTENEKQYTFNGPVGVGMYTYVPEEFEYRLYEDPEYTKDGVVDITKDHTYYLKRVQETADNPENDNILMEIYEANQVDTLVNNNGRVNATYNFFLAGDQTAYLKVYKDKNRYVFEDDYEEVIEEKELIYAIIKETKAPYLITFIEDTYKFFENDSVVSELVAYLESEYVISSEVKDGKLYLVTGISEADAKLYSDGYGYAVESISGGGSEYILNKETKEIFEMKTYLIVDGEKVWIAETSIDVECEEYIPDEAIRKTLEEGEQRTVTIITDAGTEYEKQYSFSGPVGVGIYTYMPEEFEYVFYEDPECTKEAVTDTTKDRTLYLKRITE